MLEVPGANMRVYRDGRKRVPAKDLVRRLEQALSRLRTDFTADANLSALLRAGELECALSDAELPDAGSAFALTDQLASMACCPEPHAAISIETCRRLLASIRHDGEVTVSRPEGFAYYALHPLDFSDLVSAAELRDECAHVVGIRTIGTTLSAVVAARLNADGIPATRTTVRPEGHPYDRQAAFNDGQRDAIQHALSGGALFLVCDEGPGRSGSSLLSVCEALEGAGVDREHIVLLCSHRPSLDTLCAHNAAERWGRYRTLASGMTGRLPRESGEWLGAGQWRSFFLPRKEAWAAAWPQMERLKFLSSDRRKIYKFEGYGPYGEEVGQREYLLSASGLGVRYLGCEAGFGIQQLASGDQIDVATPSLGLLRHVAKYCAWRAEAFPASVPQQDFDQLEQMAAFNIEQAFGLALELRLEVERPAVCDGRMQPHEWHELEPDHWIKLDASTHGDDHFFPGPTDIAWDLAGICIEWQLDADDREVLLSEYRRTSGDNPMIRLPHYEIAYAAFRLGWSQMAAASVSGTDDERRLLHDAARYRRLLEPILATSALTR